jgi:hypothetical protein
MIISVKLRRLKASYWSSRVADWGDIAPAEPAGYAACASRQIAVEKGGVVGIDNSGGDPATECSKQSERGGV